VWERDIERAVVGREKWEYWGEVWLNVEYY
jgi:hypothetical protein